MNAPFGRRLDDHEYERRMTALYDGSSPSSSERRQPALRRRELELTIDHKLGVDFPADRREALWQARRRIHRRQVSVALMALARKAIGSRKSVEEPLLNLLVREYGKVLTPAELVAMLDLPTGFATR